MLLLAAVATAVPCPASAQTAVSEHQVKAAFLFNFVKFVTWPPESFASADDPVALCVVGHDPLAGSLEQLAAGKTVNNRRLEVRRVAEPAALRNCHLAFVGADQDRPRDYLAATRAAPVLTVGETGQFGSWGGIITFATESDRVKFEINLEAADNVGLKISSKLLSLARAVNVGKGGP